MTVAQLITELQSYPPEAVVLIERIDPDGDPRTEELDVNITTAYRVDHTNLYYTSMQPHPIDGVILNY